MSVKFQSALAVLRLALEASRQRERGGEELVVHAAKQGQQAKGGVRIERDEIALSSYLQ